MAQINTPLFVDLDGTLIKTDLLHEGVFRLIKKSPFYLFLLLVWLLRGKAYFKQQIALHAEPNFSLLPGNDEFISFLKQEKQNGRTLYLATASDIKYAEKVAVHFDFFDGILASDGHNNLRGIKKAEQCRNLVGEFSYAGNEAIDFEIFKDAMDSYLVNPDKAALKRCRVEPVTRIWQDPQPGLGTWVKALRLHQWLKNFLLFIPLFVSHSYQSIENIGLTMMGFLAFGLLASATYIFNDLLDLDDDRAHPRKNKRPFASGALQIKQGVAAISGLLLASVCIAFFTSTSFQLVLGCYLVLTLTYSLVLKQYVMIDVLALASLYTVRIIAGAVLLELELSFWLLSFSMFIFLSLALVKRCTEIKMLIDKEKERASGRDYTIHDYTLMQSIGVTSAFLAILVLALFIQSAFEGNIYRSPMLLWMIFPALIYWICRMWLKTNRNEMTDDPIVFSIKDRGSLLTVLFICVTTVLARII